MAKYKQISEIRRVPLGNLRVIREHRPYLTEEEFQLLLDGEVVVEEKLDGSPQTIEREGYVFFCEDLHWKHSIEYTRVPPPMGPDIPSFWICYDVWMEDENRWADREEKEILCEAVGLPLAPLVHKGRLTKEQIPGIADMKSAFGETQAEGIVIKNYGKGLFGKFINREFLEGLEDAEHWRRKPRVSNRIST
jgi:ATP-dependent RNA circularization protein (DNA/RNA ligase family)